MKQSDGKMFEPTPSGEHEGYYMTYLDMCDKSKRGEKSAKPDEFLPSILKLEESQRLGRCKICCFWNFASKTEKEQHYCILHNISSVASIALRHSHAPAGKHVCRYNSCNRVFKSYHQLKKHRKTENHCRNKRKAAATREKVAQASKRAGNMTTGHFLVAKPVNDAGCEQMDIQESSNEERVSSGIWMTSSRVEFG